MPIMETTYYYVKCDDCDVETGHLGDYSAWVDPGQAEDDWGYSDQWMSVDRTIYLCWDHAPRCLCGEIQIPGDGGECWEGHMPDDEIEVSK